MWQRKYQVEPFESEKTRQSSEKFNQAISFVGNVFDLKLGIRQSSGLSVLTVNTVLTF